MKKMFKYLLITVLTFGFLSSVNALTLSKDDIDFDSQVAKYDESKDSFEIVTSTNTTIQYNDVQIADGSTDELIDAYNKYKDDPTEENKTLLSSYLTATEIDDNLWSSTPLTSYSAGSSYIKWAKVTDNENDKVTYSFGIHKETGTASNPSEENDPSEETNPDTGINPLYLIPVMVVVGSVLVFKKRRYE